MPEPLRLHQSGKTKQDAIVNIKEAIHGYIASLEEDHLSVPEERFDTLLLEVRPSYRQCPIGNARPSTCVGFVDHRELDRGTLRAILRQAGVEVSEFVQHL